MIAWSDNNDICFFFDDKGDTGIGGLTWFGRCCIRSVAALTYMQAHRLLQGNSPNEFNQAVPPRGQAGQAVDIKLWPDLRKDLSFLTAFGRSLKQKRSDSGSLEIVQAAGAELRYSFDAEGIPIMVHGHEELEIHGTIAELMILANSSVAQVLEMTSPKEALLRVHGSPVLNKFDDINALIQEVAQRDSSGSGTLSQDLRILIQDYTSAIENKMKRSNNNNSDETNLKSFVELVHLAVVKALSEAKYVCSGQLAGELSLNDLGGGRSSDLKGHYGLGLRHYTHFTSPIRRYADVVVHRQLLFLLNQVIQFHQKSNSSCNGGATTQMLLEFLHKL
jgi:exoribonuclease R